MKEGKPLSLTPVSSIKPSLSYSWWLQLDEFLVIMEALSGAEIRVDICKDGEVSRFCGALHNLLAQS